MIRIERLEGPGAAATVEPLLREYVPWVAAEAATLGITFDDTDAETLTLMTAARGLDRSLGFRDTPGFAGSQAALSGLDPFTLYMALDLAAAPSAPSMASSASTASMASMAGVGHRDVP
jgi:hypothetical protein